MSFELTVLGSSSALPTSDRYSTAQVLNIRGRFFLIDCGEGTQIQLRKFKIPFNRISHILISHLHGDHYYGLPGLISSFAMLGRKKNLTIIAHEDLKKVLDVFLSFYEEPLPFEISFVALGNNRANILYEDEKISVNSFPLKHRIPTSGFIFREKPGQKRIDKKAIEDYKLSIAQIVKIKNGEDLLREDGKIVLNKDLTLEDEALLSYAFCSDTKYSESIIKHVSGVRLLYHEATFLENMKNRAKETFHSTAKDAALIAQKADVKQLLLGHFSARYKDLSPFLKEAGEIFPNTILATDGLIVRL